MDGLDIPENSTTTDCPFDARVYALVAAAAAVSGFVSLLASLWVIFIIILFKKWKFFTQRLVLYLALAAALKSSATILQRVDYKDQTSTFYTGFCVFGGFYSQVTSWMIVNAAVTITISLLVTSFSSKPPEKYESSFLVLIFLTPLTFSWIPFIKSAYGRAGPWCWIRSRDSSCENFRFGQALQFSLFYVPVYAVLVVLMVLYGILLVKLQRNKKRWTGNFDPDGERLRKVTAQQIRPLIFFPMVYFLLYLPLLINRIYAFVNPDNPQPILWFIAAILFPMEGGCVAIVFTLDPKTRRRLRVASIKAALNEFKKNKIQEYPIEHVESGEGLKEVRREGGGITQVH